MSSRKVGRAQEFAAMTPIERERRSFDIAKLAAFLASGDVSFITGANVDINGDIFFRYHEQTFGNPYPANTT